MRGTALITAAIAAACLAAGPASAATTAYAVGEGSPNNIPLAIPVTASITTACGFAPNAAPNDSYFAPSLDQGFTHDTSFTLQCSTPLRMAIVSSNGGLLTPGAAPAGYSALAPYNVTLNIVGDGALTANGTCTAATLSAGSGSPCTFRGPSSTTQGLKLNGPSNNQAGSYVRISAPIYAGSNILLASTGYADTLTVTLSVSP
jgi:hypothetical protein